MVSGRVTSIEGCRQIAHEIWRVERPAEPFMVHGLCSERAVRERLQKTAMELEQSAEVPDEVALKLMAINFTTDDPLSILERTETMIAQYRPGAHASCEDLIQGAGRAGALVMRLLIVQSIGGRLGRWAVRSPEIPDARTARALYKDLGDATWSQYRALLETSEELFATARFREAAASLLDADRLVRTAAGLLRASTALTKIGDYISALWTIRACLLEQRGSFESPGALERALRLESRLRAVIEGRSSVPLSIDESRMLLGEEDPPLLLTAKKSDIMKPKPTAELIQRTPPPLRKSAAFSVAPTKVEGQKTEPLSPKAELAKLPPPLKPRKSTLPPNRRHVVMLEAERLEAPLLTEQVDFAEMDANTEIPPSPPVRAALTGASEVITAKHVIGDFRPLIARATTLPPSPLHRSLLREETDELRQTWDEARVVTGEPAQLVSETYELERISIDAGGEIEIDVELDLDDFKAEPLEPNDWIVQPALEDLPTDTSMPRPPSVIPAPAIYEITERIRDRPRN
jgi:hypothetical protein